MRPGARRPWRAEDAGLEERAEKGPGRDAGGRAGRFGRASWEAGRAGAPRRGGSLARARLPWANRGGSKSSREPWMEEWRKVRHAGERGSGAGRKWDGAREEAELACDVEARRRGAHHGHEGEMEVEDRLGRRPKKIPRRIRIRSWRRIGKIRGSAAKEISVRD
uniref:Uncharacterized protein n=1 Tax=Zea mays TaxID=4577 RepID=A0A804LRH7_MAIZE